MARLSSPCLTCGELSRGSRCEDCTTIHNRITARAYETVSARNKGYDKAWDRLSSRARALQQFCLECGSTEDLQADHTPEAWRRKERGLAIRLKDIQVLCGPCNRRAGEARPGSPRAIADLKKKRRAAKGGG